METETAKAAPEPPCCFCAMDGFRDSAAVAMLAPERDEELQRSGLPKT
jgi:hypothetical protein